MAACSCHMLGKTGNENMGLSILSLSHSSLYSHLSGKTVLLKSYIKENVSDVLQNFIVDFSKDMAQKNKINAAV